MSPQESIAHYRITAKLGEGGMGVVYRATDTKLNREVAVKVLPDSFAADPDRLTRFTREAQVLASLNHPNIAAIYGVEERALVLELVDGPTLAERIAAGPVPVDEALPIARQIAEALEYAHEKGIVHRDLKPANVKITPEGRVKVLDFGLAKALEADSGAAIAAGDATHSPTITLEGTRAGVILGTARYMSPEQARGDAVDKRSDVWAFGVVLYEMLTGAPLFPGETVSDTLAGVLKSKIDLSVLPPTTPLALRRLIERCLERDPKRRLRDIGDALFESEPAAAPAAPPSARASYAGWIAAALIPIATAAGWFLHRPSAPSLPSVHWSYTQEAPFGWYGLAVSRDGSRIAYYELTSNSHISVRMTDQLDARPVPGTEGGAYPVFSPDGQWIAFFTGVANYGLTPIALKKIRVSGGVPMTIAEDVPRVVATWGDDDSIVYCGKAGLERIPSAGGTPQQLTAIDTKKGENAHGRPSYLPGSRALLFAVYTVNSVDVYALDLKSGVRHLVVKDAQVGRYLPTGHIVYPRGGTLFAARFNLKTLTVTGAEVPVVQSSQGMFGAFGISDSGLLAYMNWTHRSTREPR